MYAIDAHTKHMGWMEEEELAKLPISEEHKGIARAISVGVNWAMYSMTALEQVLIDMNICYRMAGRFPWDPKYIRRSDHLHFVWMSYVNLCYLFEERIKFAVRMLSSVQPLLKVKLDAGKYVSRVEREFGDRIRDRGRHMHQGRPGDEKIMLYRALEMVQQFGTESDTEPFKQYNIKVTRKQLRAEIRETIEQINGMLNDFYQEFGAPLAQAIDGMADFKKMALAAATRH